MNEGRRGGHCYSGTDMSANAERVEASADVEVFHSRLRSKQLRLTLRLRAREGVRRGGGQR